MKFKIISGLILALLASACSVPKTVVTELDQDQLRGAYQQAVDDAREPTTDAISRNLVPITRDNPDLVWNENGHVLMAAWTRSSYYEENKPGDSIALYGDTWLTAAPFLQNFCKTFQGENLTLRLAQRLGMPPDRDYDMVVEFWVDPANMYRPCPDPEISDMECMVRVPLVDQGPAPGDDKPPWYCGEDANQVSKQFVVVDQSHLSWMCTNWTGSYTDPDLYKQYPWTALGYTYDWGGPVKYGESEFIAPGKSQVTIHSKTLTGAYCGR